MRISDWSSDVCSSDLITRSPTGIVTCLLDNPQRRNALNGGMLQALCEIYAVAGQDPGIRAVVLRGAHGTFCAGRDLRELEARHDDSDARVAERIAPVTRLAQAGRHCAVPTVAAVEGKRTEERRGGKTGVSQGRSRRAHGPK